jgi:hypothetical protein
MKFKILLLAILIGCNTPRMAEKKIQSAYKHHPEVVAKFLNDSLPCVTTRIDTIAKKELEYITLKCPDFDYNSAMLDTIWLTHSKTQLIEGSSVIAYEKEYITIEKSIKDSAEVMKYKLQLKSCVDQLNKAKDDNQKLTKKVDGKNKWLMWLVIALLISIIVNLIQYKL